MSDPDEAWRVRSEFIPQLLDICESFGVTLLASDAVDRREVSFGKERIEMLINVGSFNQASDIAADEVANRS